MGSAAGERQLALPWHGLGTPLIDEEGVTFTGRDSASLRVLLSGRQPFQVLLQKHPGPPTPEGAEDLPYAITIGSGEAVTLVACIDLGDGIEELECVDDDFLVRLPGDRFHTHRATDDGWTIELDRGDPIELGGLRPEPEPAAAGGGMAVPGDRFMIGAAGVPEAVAKAKSRATVARVTAAPALDGSLRGFPDQPSLTIDRAEQFRRAEAPWPGAGAFAAKAWLAHDGQTLYLAVEVTGEPAFRLPDTADPEWENENPDIHGAGIQVYVENTGHFGWLIVPDAHDHEVLRVSGARGTDGEPAMIAAGAWQPTERGYRITCAIEVPEELSGDIGFDLLINQGDASRERRVGQLVWSGTQQAPRLYLAGDRAPNLPLPRVALA
jgi:hypothetical protein